MKRSRIIGMALAGANVILVLLCAFLYLGKDRQEPEITFQAVDAVYQEGMDTEALLTGVTARDTRDGDLSDRIVIERISEDRQNKTVVVFYAVSDGAGNVARASRVFDAVFMEQDEDDPKDREMEGQPFEAGITAELKERDTDKEAEVDEEPESPAPVETPKATEKPTPLPAASQAPEQERTPAPENGPEPEDEPASEEASEEGTMADTGNHAPVLSLKTSEVEVEAGQGPAWVDLIETLSDDRDGYETLFRNLSVSRYDRNKPGTYQVSVSTEDSDGNISETVPLTIIVK